MLQHEVQASNFETQQNWTHFARLILQGIDSLALQGFAFCRGLSLLTQLGEFLALEKNKSLSVANDSQFQLQNTKE